MTSQQQHLADSDNQCEASSTSESSCSPKSRILLCLCGAKNRLKHLHSGTAFKCANCHKIIAYRCGCDSLVNSASAVEHAKLRCPKCGEVRVGPDYVLPIRSNVVSSTEQAPHESHVASGSKICNRCGTCWPATRRFFGSARSGNGKLRNRCRACERGYSREWASRQPDAVTANEQRRRSRQAGFVVTPKLKDALHAEQRGRCALCGLRLDSRHEWQVDHLIPLARGGSSAEINLVVAHSHCNREKCSKTLAEYMSWRDKVGLAPSNFSNHKTDQALFATQE